LQLSNIIGVMDSIYDLMQKEGLLNNDKIFDFCYKNKIEKVMEVCLEAFGRTIKKDQVTPSLFNFSASFTLSGGGYPCQTPTCRVQHVERLVKFSSLYSDSTTIHNPFDFAYSFMESKIKDEPSPERLREEALTAFLITFEFRPLIERGFINFSRTVYGICSRCKKRVDNVADLLYEDMDRLSKEEIFPLLAREVDVKYERNSIGFPGIEKFIGEEIFFHFIKTPKFLYKNGKKLSSIQELGYENPIIAGIIGEAIDSLYLQKLGCLENVTRTYLTTNGLEKLLLDKMRKPSENKVVDFFANNLPVGRNITYQDIIKMRDSYSDNFKYFQENVSNLIKKANEFETQEEFNIYVSSTLESQLKDLKKIQSEGNRKITGKSIIEGSFFGASIAISLITNSGLPLIFSFAKALYDCSKLTAESLEIEEKVERSPVYFYYKLQSLSS